MSRVIVKSGNRNIPFTKHVQLARKNGLFFNEISQLLLHRQSCIQCKAYVKTSNDYTMGWRV